MAFFFTLKVIINYICTIYFLFFAMFNGIIVTKQYISLRCALIQLLQSAANMLQQ